jgi:hypothetical protein
MERRRTERVSNRSRVRWTANAANLVVSEGILPLQTLDFLIEFTACFVKTRSKCPSSLLEPTTCEFFQPRNGQ